MLTLRRFITKEWLLSFLASCFILMLLVAIGDIVNELLRAVTTLPDILLHHLLEWPKWLNKIFPIAALTATLFCLNKLQRRGELMAIFACGFPRYAFLTVIFRMALLVAAAQFLNSAFVRPYSESLPRRLLRDGGIHFRKDQDRTEGIKTSNSVTGRIWYKNASYYCSFAAFDKSRNELREVTFFYYGPDYKLVQIIWAQRARYLRGNSWQLIDGRMVNSLQNKNFPQTDVFHTKNVSLLERPNDFKDIDSEINELAIQKLYAYIKKINRLGISSSEYETLFYEKISSALVCLFFPFIAIGPIYNPNRRHSSFGRSVFFILIFSTIFWLTYSSCLALGSGAKVPPELATFFIPLCSVLYIMLSFYRRRKL